MADQARPRRATTIISSGTISARGSAVPPARRIAEPDVADPSRLTRMLNDMQEDVAEAVNAHRGNPHSAPCIVRGLVFAAGESKTIRHTLGKPYSGWLCVRCQGAAAQLHEGALPAGMRADQALQVISDSAGTYDIAISAD